jgi:uncharacterized membrane protein
MFWQETVQNIAENSAFHTTEQTIVAAVQWLKLGVEAVGALIIGYGVILAIFQFVAHFRDKKPDNLNSVRLTLGKYLTLALEFQVGADILSTAIAPSWEQIGKLAAIVAVRTLLNYFLTKEVENEQKREEEATAETGADKRKTKT